MSSPRTESRTEVGRFARASCRFCGAPLSYTFVDREMSPLCESNVSADRVNALEAFYPLQGKICERCLRVQLEEFVAPEKRLTGRVCVVTGASSGIGRAIALALAAVGADVCAVGRRPSALEETAQRAEPARIAVHPADLTVDEQLTELARAYVDRGLDVLVHCAGTYARGPIERARVEDLDLLYRVNLRAPFRLTQALLPALKASQGQIVFINSSAGLEARAEVGQYAATKHALKALADTLREEINPSGVRVLSVYPGRTAGKMQASIYALEGREYTPETLMQPEDVAATVVAALTLPRTAELTDLRVRPMRKH